MHTLDNKQVRTLPLIFRDTRFECLLWLAEATGLRQGELLGLRWSDLDWQSHKLHIQRQLQRLKEGVCLQ